MSGLIVAMAFAGFAFGLLYFIALRWTVTLFAGRGGWLGPLALTLGRIGAAAVFLAAAARMGAATLLAAFLGFLLARTLALRAAGRAN
ncbi:MAG: ATP synthase subunit I [Rhodomicrobium sp.]